MSFISENKQIFLNLKPQNISLSLPIIMITIIISMNVCILMKLFFSWKLIHFLELYVFILSNIYINILYQLPFETP